MDKKSLKGFRFLVGILVVSSFLYSCSFIPITKKSYGNNNLAISSSAIDEYFNSDAIVILEKRKDIFSRIFKIFNYEVVQSSSSSIPSQSELSRVAGWGAIKFNLKNKLGFSRILIFAKEDEANIEIESTNSIFGISNGKVRGYYSGLPVIGVNKFGVIYGVDESHRSLEYKSISGIDDEIVRLTLGRVPLSEFEEKLNSPHLSVEKFMGLLNEVSSQHVDMIPYVK